MKLIIGFFLTLSFNLFAQQFNEIEGADIACTNGDAGAVFFNSQAKRLWNAEDVQQSEGMEMPVRAVTPNSCKDCYEVTVQFEGDDEVSLIYTFSGVDSSEDNLIISSYGKERTRMSCTKN